MTLKNTDLDHFYMREALKEAEKGRFTAHPNPRVGCVMVKENKIIARGGHLVTGSAHAEINAIEHATESLESAICYVTLEPCAHEGLTKPCMNALIQHKIKRCVIAVLDPNPLVAGRGAEALREAGIEVEVGILESEARKLNEGFFMRMQKVRPRVTAKVAASLDGKTAFLSGESQWITSLDARMDAHQYRAESGAILTSWATVNSDDPSMNVRDAAIVQIPHFKQPLRVVIDAELKSNPKAQLFSLPGKTMVCVHEGLSESEEHLWREALVDVEQVEVVRITSSEKHLDLNALLLYLGKRGINDVFLESGARLLGAFFEAKLIDACILYFAPKILGNQTKGMFELPIQNLAEHIRCEIETVEKVGVDLKIQTQILYV